MTTQLPDWLPNADRVWAVMGNPDLRGRFITTSGNIVGMVGNRPIMTEGFQILRGGVWLWRTSCNPDVASLWYRALDRYTGDRSDGPVSLRWRECDCASSPRSSWLCPTCKPFGGTGKVAEIVRDVDVTGRLVFDMPLGSVWTGTHNQLVRRALSYLNDDSAWPRDVNALRFEIDERECGECDGGYFKNENSKILRHPCPTCNGTGKLAADEYTLTREGKK